MTLTKQIDDDGRDYVLQEFADRRADEVLPAYWAEYMKTGRVSDFDLDSYNLELQAISTGVHDFKIALRNHIRREIIAAANDKRMSREWKNTILGPCTIWSY